MQQLILEYYTWLSSLFNALASPIQGLASSINLPLVSVLLFGLLGTTAPCQLSTNVAALAFLSRGVNDHRRVWGQMLAFIAGKVTVYLLVGGLVVALGLRLSQVGSTVIPVVVVARRALGPLLIGVGLLMLGLLSSRLSLGGRFSSWLNEKVTWPRKAGQKRLSSKIEVRGTGHDEKTTGLYGRIPARSVEFVGT